MTFAALYLLWSALHELPNPNEITMELNSGESPLKGLRVLVVEDETLVAMLVEEYLTELGCVIAGSARRVPKALEIIDGSAIDAAVLDLNVAGEDVSPIVAKLVAKSVPFIFASGYGEKGLPANWASYQVLQKPFSAGDLQTALLSAVSARDATTA